LTVFIHAFVLLGVRQPADATHGVVAVENRHQIG
jgi:hypothetical protein